MPTRRAILGGLAIPGLAASALGQPSPSGDKPMSADLILHSCDPNNHMASGDVPWIIPD